MEQCKPHGRRPLHFTGSYTARSYLDHIKTASVRGNAAAQFTLGISLFRGDIGDPDLEGAVSWIRRSACAECPYVGFADTARTPSSYRPRVRYAMFQLGMWYLRGLDPLIAACERSALQWYESGTLRVALFLLPLGGDAVSCGDACPLSGHTCPLGERWVG
jgi:TPR repeat protein